MKCKFGCVAIVNNMREIWFDSEFGDELNCDVTDADDER